MNYLTDQIKISVTMPRWLWVLATSLGILLNLATLYSVIS